MLNFDQHVTRLHFCDMSVAVSVHGLVYFVESTSNIVQLAAYHGEQKVRLMQRSSCVSVGKVYYMLSQ